jgi:hypothetical protein
MKHSKRVDKQRLRELGEKKKREGGEYSMAIEGEGGEK